VNRKPKLLQYLQGTWSTEEKSLLRTVKLKVIAIERICPSCRRSSIDSEVVLSAKSKLLTYFWVRRACVAKNLYEKHFGFLRSGWSDLRPSTTAFKGGLGFSEFVEFLGGWSDS